MTEIQSSFDDFLRDGGYDGPREEQRDPFVAQLNISESLPVIKAIEEFRGFDSVQDEKGMVEEIQHQRIAVTKAEKDLCPDGEFLRKFVPVAAVKDKRLGTIVLHLSLDQDDNEKISGDVIYLTRVRAGKKSVGIARFNSTVEEEKPVVIHTYETKGNPFKRNPIQHRGSREMLSLLGKFLENPKNPKHLVSAYRCLLRSRPLSSDSLDGNTKKVQNIENLSQKEQPPLVVDVNVREQDSLMPIEKYKGTEGGIIDKTIECIKSLDLKIPSLTIEERDKIIEEVARNRSFQKLLIYQFSKFAEQINKQIEEVNIVEGFIARGNIGEMKEYIPLIATYTNHEDGMFILHRSIENNGWGNTYYLTRLVKKEYRDFIDARKFTVSENDNPNSPVFFEMIDLEEMIVPRYSCPPEVRKEILNLVNTKKPDLRKLRDLYSLMLFKSERLE